MSRYTCITDLDHPGLEVFTQLREPQLYHYYEPSPGLFIAETPNVIRRCVAAGYEPVCMLAEESLADEACDILSSRPDTPVYVCPLESMKKITGFALTHGMLCSMRRKELPAAEDLLGEIESAAPEHAARIAVLEGVVNPTNVGAIFRSAAALGISAVLLTNDCADPLQRRCARVSMGTVFQIPWTFVSDDWNRLLHTHGYRTAAMALESDSVPVSDERLKHEKKLAIVLGSEGYGLKKETIRQSDYTVLIPMAHGVDSLNVAAAAAVAFWEIVRFV